MRGGRAWEALRSAPVDLVVAQLDAPETGALALLRRIRAGEGPPSRLPVIVVAADATLSAAVEAGRLGASDFLPLSDEGAARLVERAAQLLAAPPPPPVPDALVGPSRALRALRERLAALAELDVPVLLRGPPHAGHDAAAAHLHALGPRAAQPFRRHEAGGAPLALEAPGTLHVVGAESLSPSEQQTLRAELRRAATGSIAGRTRLVVSSGPDPHAAVEAGRLDAELLEHLARFALRLPALRDRRADVPELLERFLERSAARLGRPGTQLSAPAALRLGRHPWRHDLRDLARVAERLVALAPGGRIHADTADAALAELDDPLERIVRRREREERRLLLELYERHGTYTGVARDLGLTRNAAKYRFAKHGLIPGRRTGPEPR